MSNQSKLSEKTFNNTGEAFNHWFDNHGPESMFTTTQKAKDLARAFIDWGDFVKEAYHLQKLESVSEEEINEKFDVDLAHSSYDETLKKGAREGAKWLLTHLKEKE